MPLEPEVQAILKGMEEAGGPAISEMTPEVAREAFEAMLPLQGEPEAVGHVEDREVPGPGGAVKVRVYRPVGTVGPMPVLCFIHGGGWVLMDLDSHDPVCRGSLPLGGFDHAVENLDGGLDARGRGHAARPATGGPG